MNQAIISGNIGAEPTVQVFNSGKKVARFSVAINSYTKDREKRPEPTWVPCELWDAAVERLQKCQQKAPLRGRQIQITGSLAVNQFTKQVGIESVKMTKLYIKVQSFELIGGLQGEESPEPQPADPSTQAAPEVTTLRNRKTKQRA